MTYNPEQYWSTSGHGGFLFAFGVQHVRRQMRRYLFAFQDSKLIYFLEFSFPVMLEQNKISFSSDGICVLCVFERDSKLGGAGCLLWHNAQTTADRHYGMREHKSHASGDKGVQKWKLMSLSDTRDLHYINKSTQVSAVEASAGRNAGLTANKICTVSSFELITEP